MRLDWRARGSRDIRAISDYCLHVSAVRVPDADGFSLGPSQPRPDVADPKSGAAIQRHEGRSFLFPAPPFDGHWRPSRELAELGVVEQCVVAELIENDPHIPARAVCAGSPSHALRREDLGSTHQLGYAPQTFSLEMVAKGRDVCPIEVDVGAVDKRRRSAAVDQ